MLIAGLTPSSRLAGETACVAAPAQGAAKGSRQGHMQRPHKQLKSTEQHTGGMQCRFQLPFIIFLLLWLPPCLPVWSSPLGSSIFASRQSVSGMLIAGECAADGHGMFF